MTVRSRTGRGRIRRACAVAVASSLSGGCVELGADVLLGQEHGPSAGGIDGGQDGNWGSSSGGRVTTGGGSGGEDPSTGGESSAAGGAGGTSGSSSVSPVDGGDSSDPKEGFQTERVNVSESGEEADLGSSRGQLSSDGRFVVFSTRSRILMPDGQASGEEVLLRDRLLGTLELISVSSTGERSNGWSTEPVVSGDGRIVAFYSSASNLVPDDENDDTDLFVRDRWEGTTERIATRGAGWLRMSHNGRFIVFRSRDETLVSNDTNGLPDIFIFDRVTRETERIDVSSTGEEANASASLGTVPVSDDGRYVVFVSSATNLVDNDQNGKDDVFLRDRQQGVTRRLSDPDATTEANGHSGLPAISGNGRFVVFSSEATNLLPSPQSPLTPAQLYVRDLELDTRELLSVAIDGSPGDGSSHGPCISIDGSVVAFDSDAKNLVPLDTGVGSAVYVRDRRTNQTFVANVSTDGVYGNWPANNVALSGDGVSVGFLSRSTNLVPQTNNLVTDLYVRDLRRPAFLP